MPQKEQAKTYLGMVWREGGAVESARQPGPGLNQGAKRTACSVSLAVRSGQETRQASVGRQESEEDANGARSEGSKVLLRKASGLGPPGSVGRVPRQ